MLNEALKRIMEAKNENEDQVMANFAIFVGENYPEIWTQAEQSLEGLDEEDYEFFSSAFVKSVLILDAMRY